MKAILLGPGGQLGTDIRACNERTGRFLDIIPVDRARIDLSDIEAAAKLLRELDFDLLINCSSYHRTDEAERNANLAFTINAHLVQRLAEVTEEKGATLVHFSTDYVFGGQALSAPIPETGAKAPVSVYGASKAMGEDLALLAGSKVFILRVASLFGVAGASGKGGNFVETMIRLGRERGVLNVVADQIMSPTATADIAEAVLKLLKSGAPGGIWHAVNSGQASWYEFACRIIKRAGIKATVSPIPSIAYPTPAKRPAYSVLDNAKLVSATGPLRPWRDALDGYLAAKGYAVPAAS
jgi:dTDP-4-dehydrorhamnose reductase